MVSQVVNHTRLTTPILMSAASWFGDQDIYLEQTCQSKEVPWVQKAVFDHNICCYIASKSLRIQWSTEHRLSLVHPALLKTFPVVQVFSHRPVTSVLETLLKKSCHFFLQFLRNRNSSDKHWDTFPDYIFKMAFEVFTNDCPSNWETNTSGRLQKSKETIHSWLSL